LIGAAALTLVLATAEGALLGIRWFRDAGRARAVSPFLRGREVASGLGCFGCHGPEGELGIPNPRARDGEIPSWSGGNYMMFNVDPNEIREWVLDGIPSRLRNDPADQDRRSKQLISMPAYKGRVSGRDLDDLVAYVQAISAAFKPPEGNVAEGRGLAVDKGCFGCHGPEGRGLVSNPGSFKGYIPSWDSGDYAELVRSPDEFREWVERGEIKRLRDNPAAAHFLDGQIVRMPAYRGVLSVAEIDKIRAYVEWVRNERTAAAIARM
jgi:mono/diheme cytochrome c family protein